MTSNDKSLKEGQRDLRKKRNYKLNRSLLANPPSKVDDLLPLGTCFYRILLALTAILETTYDHENVKKQQRDQVKSKYFLTPCFTWIF
jgi:hypothetical protein